MMDSMQDSPKETEVYCIGTDTVHSEAEPCNGWHMEWWKAPDWGYHYIGEHKIRYCKRCNYSGSCRCMWCVRCNQVTGNTNQGHFWAFCKVTGTMRDFHFCCPDNCQLEETV